jgi:two-component system, NarL family, nitrate/nitrite response regulator NarL
MRRLPSTQAGPTGRAGPIRVLVADQHPLFRDALGRALRRDPALELVHEAAGAADLAAAISRHRPDVALVDADLAGALTAEHRRFTRLLVLAAEDDAAGAYAAVESGAAGYVTRDADGEVICRAVAAVARGDGAFDADVQTRIARGVRLRHRDDRPILTAREREVLVLIAKGLLGPTIAERLQVSTPTVKTHQQRLYGKLGVADRAAAVAEGMRQGLIE